MDDYSHHIYSRIIRDSLWKTSRYNPSDIEQCSAGLHKLVQKLEARDDIIFNYNEEGRLHSNYLGDRYEPAIIFRFAGSLLHYYLFDGEIKDCIHPFMIFMSNEMKYIGYYSSKRIEQELPLSIQKQRHKVVENYNKYNSLTVLDGYKQGMFEIDIADDIEQDYLLHDYMEPAMPFKFAD